MSGSLVNIKTYKESVKYLPNVFNEYIIYYEPDNDMINRFFNDDDKKRYYEKYYEKEINKIKNKFFKRKMYDIAKFKKPIFHLKTIKKAETIETIHKEKNEYLDLAQVLIENNYFYFDVNDLIIVSNNI